MSRESYTPGHTSNSVAFMADRNVYSHAQFFTPHLAPDMSLLDVGCGPGTISLGLASLVTSVHGVDFAASQVEEAESRARDAECTNATFSVASAYELPFADETFDCVFSHALMEHLAEPKRAMAEFFRVLKPGGKIGVCSPDADGWLLAPDSAELLEAAEAYVHLQDSNGGNLRVGKRLGAFLVEAGFGEIIQQGRYENFEISKVGEYLAIQLDQAGFQHHAKVMREWQHQEAGMFAQSWVWATARRSSTESVA